MDSSVIAVGIIETFAGNGKSRSTGDGKPAAKAGMPLPVSVAIDPQTQSLYYAESGSDRVRRIELATGIISHVAGIGETCYSGDGDRKSTRLNSSHGYISYAVFCLK